MNTKDIIDILNDFLGLIVGIATGVGGIFAWQSTRKKSTRMLYAEMEKLEIQIIERVQSNLKKTKEIAKKDQILNDVKLQCPQCYDKIMKKYEIHERIIKES